MSKVRQILKLHSQGIGKKKNGTRLAMSKNTVKLYIDKYMELRISLDELMKLNDYELDKHFHPSQERLIKACKIAHDIDFDEQTGRIIASNYNHETEKNEEVIYHFSPTNP